MRLLRLLPFFLLLLGLFATPSCRTKSGCEATTSLAPKVNRKGEIVARKNKDKGLFPKKMSKRMK